MAEDSFTADSAQQYQLDQMAAGSPALINKNPREEVMTSPPQCSASGRGQRGREAGWRKGEERSGEERYRATQTAGSDSPGNKQLKGCVIARICNAEIKHTNTQIHKHTNTRVSVHK